MKFKILSISKILEGLVEAAKNFPLAMVSAFVGTAIGIVLIHIDNLYYLYNILLTLLLAFFLFIATQLFCLQKNWGLKQKTIINFLAVIFLVLYYFWLPENIFESRLLFIIRYAMWLIGFALLITFSHFLKRHEKTIDGFWNYNVLLFSSLALTAVWAAVIFVGISIAITSINFLFDINLGKNRYAELAVIVFGLFSTAFFLARIKKSIKNFQDSEECPKELKLFSVCALIPLVSIYFLILYAYAIRIFIIQEWPKGTLAFMILGFSLLGILTYTITYPLRKNLPWIKKAGTIFYIILIPQIIMLFLALKFRISQYGLTENRYFVFVFGWWLLSVAIYFIFSKKKDIRIIPVSIFLIAMLTSFGPWGAFSVSEKSQVNRLYGLLRKNNLITEYKVQKSTGKINFEDRKEISAIIQYLYKVHGLKSIEPWFGEDFSALYDNQNYGKNGRHNYELPEIIVQELIGIDYVEPWEISSLENNNFYLYVNYDDKPESIIISDYDYMVRLQSVLELETVIDNNKYKFTVEDDKFIVFKNGVVILTADFINFLDKFIKEGRFSNLKQDEMKIELENENISLIIYFNNINGVKKNGGGYEIDSFAADLFFSLKK